MSSRADIVVSTPDEQVQLVVEVKNKRGASAEWAAQMRRNLLVHGVVPNAPFFLLATPDRFYLWKDGKPAGAPLAPDDEVEATEVLAPYIDRLGIQLAELSEPSLELLITSWLHDLIDIDLAREEARPAYGWLFDSGLYEALRWGSVATEVAV
jgi:hypothetical protein